jgi:hypothetical protein
VHELYELWQLLEGEIERLEDVAVEYRGLPADLNLARLQMAKESELNVKYEEEMNRLVEEGLKGAG